MHCKRLETQAELKVHKKKLIVNFSATFCRKKTKKQSMNPCPVQSGASQKADAERSLKNKDKPLVPPTLLAAIPVPETCMLSLQKESAQFKKWVQARS